MPVGVQAGVRVSVSSLDEEKLAEEPSNVPNVDITSTTKTASCVISIRAQAKPRMTQRDKWAPREVVERYWTYCDQLRLGFNRTAKFQRATGLTLTARLAVKDAKLCGKQHTKYPDLDNIIKGVLDALLIEDQAVSKIIAYKFWDETDELTIELEGVET